MAAIGMTLGSAWNVAHGTAVEDTYFNRRRGRILVVEDDLEMGRLLAQELRANGHAVVVARNGAEGLDHIMDSWGFGGQWAEEFDLVVSDFRMPGWTGLEILEIVRDTRPATPVILITAFGAADLHETAQRLGAAAVLDKPFDLHVLGGTVERLLAH